MRQYQAGVLSVVVSLSCRLGCGKSERCSSPANISTKRRHDARITSALLLHTAAELAGMLTKLLLLVGWGQTSSDGNVSSQLHGSAPPSFIPQQLHWAFWPVPMPAVTSLRARGSHLAADYSFHAPHRRQDNASDMMRQMWCSFNLPNTLAVLLFMLLLL